METIEIKGKDGTVHKIKKCTKEERLAMIQKLEEKRLADGKEKSAL